MRGMSLEDAVWEPLKLGGTDKANLIVGTLMTYLAVCADLAAGTQYTEEEDTWWYRWTLAIVFAPGLFHAVIQHFSVYRRPAARPRPGVIRLGEKAPNLEPRRPSVGQWVLYWIVCLLQLRPFVEMVLSFRWRFETGAWRDSRVIQVVTQSLPQVILQSYIMFRNWERDVPFEWDQTVVALTVALVNIAFMPVGSPCFEDKRHLARVDGDSDADSDSDDDSDDEGAYVPAAASEKGDADGTDESGDDAGDDEDADATAAAAEEARDGGVSPGAGAGAGAGAGSRHSMLGKRASKRRSSLSEVELT